MKPLAREKPPRPARQNSTVDVLPLRFRLLRNRAPGGEELNETGDRGQPRVVVRPEIDDGAAWARRTRDLGATGVLLDPPPLAPALAATGSNLRAGSGVPTLIQP